MLMHRRANKWRANGHAWIVRFRSQPAALLTAPFKDLLHRSEVMNVLRRFSSFTPFAIEVTISAPEQRPRSAAEASPNGISGDPDPHTFSSATSGEGY